MSGGPSGLGELPSPRAVMFVVWPEPSHLVAPLTLARRLVEQGTRVIFTGRASIGEHVRTRGFEFFPLSGPLPGSSAEAGRVSIFSIMPGRWALERAVDDLVEHFGAVVERHKPDLILIDSLYSAFGILAEAEGIAWAQYETDLPRELEPAVPPPSCRLIPDASQSSRRAIRSAWAESLWRVRCSRRASERNPILYSWSMASYFPDALIAELERRFGRRVRFDRHALFPPVARAPRLVFCPSELDFERRRAKDLLYVGACLDLDRPEPPFPWQRLPEHHPLVYCAFGSQSARHPRAVELLRTIIDVFASRGDLALVVACAPEYHASLATSSERVLVVGHAPQLALLERASLAITHGGFNSLKECAMFGVPTIALPWTNDQPRNAALLEHRGLGIGIDLDDVRSEVIDRAVTRVLDCPDIRRACERMQGVITASADGSQALEVLRGLACGGVTRRSSGPS